MMQVKENKGKSCKYMQEVVWKMIYIVSEVTDSRDLFRPLKPHALESHTGIPYGVEVPGVRPRPE